MDVSQLQDTVRRQQKVITGLVALVVLAVLAALTNPSRERHVDWRVQVCQGSFIGGRQAIEGRTVYHDYLLFSTASDTVDKQTLSVGYFGGVYRRFW